MLLLQDFHWVFWSAGENLDQWWKSTEYADVHVSSGSLQSRFIACVHYCCHEQFSILSYLVNFLITVNVSPFLLSKRDAVSGICYVPETGILWVAAGSISPYHFEPKSGENVGDIPFTFKPFFYHVVHMVYGQLAKLTTYQFRKHAMLHLWYLTIGTCMYYFVSCFMCGPGFRVSGLKNNYGQVCVSVL